jgi:hypothetical protein
MKTISKQDEEMIDETIKRFSEGLITADELKLILIGIISLALA